MHTVEAFLAASDATGDPLWRDRALRITQRVLGFAEGASWRIPEHCDSTWSPVPYYSQDKPGDKFRPYGATPGHPFEWARLTVHLQSTLGDRATTSLLPVARSLFDQGVRDGLSFDGQPGFVYPAEPPCLDI